MEFERRYLEWDVAKAAEACGIGRRYFYVLLTKTQRP